MTAASWPIEYHPNVEAVDGCFEALLALEQQFGTSALVDALKDLKGDNDFQARERGARPKTAAYVRERWLKATGPDGADHHDREAPIAEPFPGTGDDTEALANVIGFPLHDPYDELSVENGGGDAPSA